MLKCPNMVLIFNFVLYNHFNKLVIRILKSGGLNMYKKFRSLFSSLALTLSLLICSNSTLAFANTTSLNNAAYSNATATNSNYTVSVIYEDASTRIAKSVDSKEITLVSFNKTTQNSKMIVLPLNNSTKTAKKQDFINLFMSENSSLSTSTTQKIELKNSINRNAVSNVSVQSLSNQSVSLAFSSLSYGYFGQYSLSNTKGTNIRIAGTDVQKDGVLYTEVNNFRQQLNALKGIESDARFEAAGAVIGVLLAIPDITVSKIAAILVAAGVLVTSANLIYNYVIGTHDADGYYADIISRCNSIGVRYW